MSGYFPWRFGRCARLRSFLSASLVVGLCLAWTGGCTGNDGDGDNQNDNALANDNAGGGEDVSAPETLGGAVTVRDLTIPAGHTTRVTSDLTVTASGRVTIEGGLIADASTAVGHSITIVAQGDIDIGGLIQAGDAASAAEPKRNARSFSAAQAGDNDLVTPALAGLCGGSLELESAGQLRVRASGILTTGNGSHAQDGFPDNFGGCGGNLTLRAGTTLILRCSLIIGNGGNGGQTVTTTANLPADGLFTNGGGRAGVPLFVAPTLDIPGLRTVRNDIHALDPVAYSLSTGSIIYGGAGGSAGGVIITDDPANMPSLAGARVVVDAAQEQVPLGKGQADDVNSDTGAAAGCPAGARCLVAADGGWGWWVGGTGGTIMIAVGFDRNGHDGISWSGSAGNGGDVDEELILITPDVDAVILDGALGGLGGDATVGASPGWLGEASHRNGGNGGHASAYAGRGGNGSLYGQQTGGKGGRAIAYAGYGGAGFENGCAPGAGGNGGDGYAYGGNGGDGTTPGEGGSATALYGEGGPGGNGSPESGGGSGGVGGLLHSEGGCFGADDPNVTVQPCGLLDEHRAPDGEPGSEPYCCNC